MPVVDRVRAVSLAAAPVSPQHGAGVPPWLFVAGIIVVLAIAAVLFVRSRGR